VIRAVRRFTNRRFVVGLSTAIAFFFVIPAIFVWFGPSDLTAARGVRTSWAPPTHKAKVSVVKSGAPAADFRLEGQTLIAAVDRLSASTRTYTLALLNHPAPVVAVQHSNGCGDECDAGGD
jgi:hypothetical protein